MQTFKVILGLILGVAAIVTMVQMAGEEKGAGLAGAFTGFLILGGIAGWLIYSGTKSKGDGKNKN